MGPGYPVKAARSAMGVSMKLGFICFNLPGHLNPMTTLARHLQDRNHEVVFLYSSGAAGLPYVRSPEKDHFNENRPEVSKMQGEDALQFSARVVLAQTEAMLKTLPAIVEANGIDALVLDVGHFYAELGTMQLGMPYIHVSNALHLDFSGYTPLCLYGWPHETTPAALARNREGVAKFVRLLESSNAGIRAFAEKVGPVPSNAIIVKRAPQLELLKQTSPDRPASPAPVSPGSDCSKNQKLFDKISVQTAGYWWIMAMVKKTNQVQNLQTVPASNGVKKVGPKKSRTKHVRDIPQAYR